MALDLLFQSEKFRIRNLPGTSLRLGVGLRAVSCCVEVLSFRGYSLHHISYGVHVIAGRTHLSEAPRCLKKAAGYQLSTVISKERNDAHLLGSGESWFWEISH